MGVVSRPFDWNVSLKNDFLISQLKHIVGTQKNRLNETILLSTNTNVKTDV